MTRLLPLRPTVQNPRYWRDHPIADPGWKAIRKKVLTRDNNTCCWCGHRASKFMNVHHRESGVDQTLETLATCCVACHAVQHIGRSLSLGVIEMWACALPQVTVVQETRRGVGLGATLSEVKQHLRLKPGPYPPDSIDWANVPLQDMGENVSGSWREPVTAIFVNLKRWQIEEAGK